MRLLLCGLLLLVAACGRRTDFLYRTEPVVHRKIASEHKVKELEGNSFADILWIIDNSGSMADKQQAVINGTNDFIQQFTQKSQLRWKMGLISTDTANQPFVGFRQNDILDNNSTNPVSIFQQAVGRLGTSGSGTEMMMTPVLNVFQSFPNFNRSAAVLAMIVVTDEEEQSPMAVQQFVGNLTQTKKNLSNVLMYGVFSATDTGCSNGQFTYKNSVYEKIVVALKGKTYSVCTPNFGATLAELGQDIVKNIQRPRITLSTRPVPESIRVLHRDVELPGGLKEAGGYWLYDFELNAIVFHDLDFAPLPDEQVKIRFEEAIWQ